MLGRSARSLAASIRSGETTARAVVEEHVDHLRRAQPHTNAIACERFEAALAEADAADARVAEATDPESLPPLLGVPCTIKESIALAGMPNCAGLVHRSDHVADRSAPTVQRILDAGAIPLGVTNVSEMTMWIESHNRVYGRTHNAYDRRRTAGGSSGGEGAAVGSGGAPFGLGSDIGGSIRLPAFFNGVFGHKPSPGLVPNTGQFPHTDGDAAFMLSIGPLCRRAEDLMPVLRTIAGPDGDDRRCVARELSDPADVAIDGLRVLWSDDASLLPVSGELRAARDRAVGALAAAGAPVEQVSLKAWRRALELYLAALQDGAGTSMAAILEAAEAPLPRRNAWLYALRGRGDHTIPMLLLLSVEKLADRAPERRTRRAIAAGRSLREEVAATLDGGVLLHPPFAKVAPRHGRTVGRPWTILPAAIFNLLGTPVTQVPLGLNEAGLPLGVQVAACDGADHVTIAVALELERVFGGWVPPPYVPAETPTAVAA